MRVCLGRYGARGGAGSSQFVAAGTGGTGRGGYVVLVY